MKFKRESIKFKIWTYFMLFTLVILCGLWLFQTVFINGYYRSMKEQSIIRGAQNIADTYASEDVENTYPKITSIASENDLFVNILDLNGSTLYFNDPAGRGYGNEIKNFTNYQANPIQRKQAIAILEQEINQQPGGKLLQYYDDSNARKMFIYADIIQNANGNEAILIITSQLQPLGETVKILSEQLTYVTVTSIAIAFVLSVIIAQKVSKPLEKITEKAKLLSSGNYDIEFEKGNYSEVNQLAYTLNYATSGLKQVEKLRTELISNVSHDLRTPLTMIKAYAEMIRDISGNQEEKRNTHLSVIIEECDRLSGFVQDLLDVSKLQAGVIEYHPIEFNLTQLIRTTLNRFDVLKEKQGYMIELNCPDDLFVFGDEKKIEQALYNLLSNAINYTGEDKRIFINVEETDEKVCVKIRDTGKGIAEEDLEHIWERYYKVDKEHKRAVAGSGIGLAIVKSVFLLHETEFGVESKLGEGSTFWFNLKKHR